MSSQHPEQQAEQAADQLPARAEPDRREQPIARTGMFGAKTTGDTSGYGRLVVRQAPKVSTPRPYGGYFDQVADELERAFPQFGDAIERIVIDRGEMTLHVARARLPEIAR